MYDWKTKLNVIGKFQTKKLKNKQTIWYQTIYKLGSGQRIIGTLE